MKRNRWRLALAFACCVVLAACGSREGGNTKETGNTEAAENKLTEGELVPADPGNLELTETRFEDYNFILNLPEGVTVSEDTEGIRNLNGGIIVTDDEGEWQLYFEPYTGSGQLEQLISEIKFDQRYKESDGSVLHSKIDWSQDVPGTVAGFDARAWANNCPEKLSNSKGNLTKMPGMDLLLDYGDRVVGPYYGMYVRLQGVDYMNVNIYELLYSSKVRAIIQNFQVIESEDLQTVSVNGITLSFPWKWNAVAKDRTLIANLALDGSALIASANKSTSAEAVAKMYEENFTKNYGDKEFYGAVINTGTEQEPKYAVNLYYDYNKEDSIVLDIYYRIADADKDTLLAALDSDAFIEIISTLEVDPSQFTYLDGAKADGFRVSNGDLVEYTGTDKDVVIPEEIGGYTVTSISSSVFSNNKDIISVVIPDTVAYIDVAAFDGCTNLKSVTLPEGLQYIDYATFYECESLESIPIPKNVYYIGENAFAYCTNLKDVVIPNSVTEIDSKAFYQAGQETLTVKGAVKFQEEALIGAKFDTIILGTGCDLSERAIMSYAEMTKVELPVDLTVLGDETFIQCNNLKDIELPNTLETIGTGALESTGPIKRLEIPDKVTEIPDNMLKGSHVESVVVGSGVATIGEGGIEGNVVFLHNIDVTLANDAIDCFLLYLYGAHTQDDIPKNIENQSITDNIIISDDCSFAESDALDAYYESLGMSRLSWFGPSAEFCDTDTENFIVGDRSWLTEYKGENTYVNIPYMNNVDGSVRSIYWISDTAFSGNTKIEGICLGQINSIAPESFKGCTNLKEIWMGMAVANTMLNSPESVEDAFVGVPEDIRIHLPAGLTDEEKAKVIERCYEIGLPKSAEIDTYTVE